MLTKEEFRNDFKAAFAVFDTDGDGIIGHLEVMHYEEQILPEIKTPSAGGGRRGGGAGRSSGGGAGRGPGGERGGPPRGGGGDGGRGPGGQGGSGEGRSGGSASQPYDMSALGAARFGFLAIPHPLLDADPQMRRRISLADYLVAANERFAMLDELEQGFLERDALMERLPKRRERGNGKHKRGRAGQESS